MTFLLFLKNSRYWIILYLAASYYIQEHNINLNSYQENNILKDKVQHCELTRLPLTSRYFP